MANGWLSKSRVQLVEDLKSARVPILKMKDSLTDIEFDVSTGSSAVGKRHIEICRNAQKHYKGLKCLVLALKKFLDIRCCQKSFTGGISSFLLFYMVLAFYQNSQLESGLEILDFFKFYANFNEQTFGLRIDLSEIFPLDYKPLDEKIVELPALEKRYWTSIVPSAVSKLLSYQETRPSLYIKDPIGIFYYKADPTGSDMKGYREDIGVSAFGYVEYVKPYFIEAAKKLG